MKAVREEQVKLGGRVGFAKQVGSKPEVKERGSYEYEWWIRRGRVMGEEIGKSEMVPERG